MMRRRLFLKHAAIAPAIGLANSWAAQTAMHIRESQRPMRVFLPILNMGVITQAAFRTNTAFFCRGNASL